MYLLVGRHPLVPCGRGDMQRHRRDSTATGGISVSRIAFGTKTWCPGNKLAKLLRRPTIQSRINSGTLDHEIQHARAGTARQDGCVLARRQLPVGRPDLSLRQSAAEATADPRGREAYVAGSLGHDSRAEFYL